MTRKLRNKLDYEIIYEHLRDAEFNKDKFINVENNNITDIKDKPIEGGFWASPVDSKYSWRKVFSGMDLWEQNTFFRFTLSNNAKILYINSIESIKLIPKEFIISFDKVLNLDFEKLSTVYDALHFDPSNDECLNEIMPSWQCDCILIFNPDIIETINKKIM